ncbi:hypothetical protein J6590_013214 [Homalodisca vitripennis]|nr:hypothetical protein J6590_013214 [Homalodisca vitripennis]
MTASAGGSVHGWFQGLNGTTLRNYFHSLEFHILSLALGGLQRFYKRVIVEAATARNRACSSFFGRSYNNMNSITPCKNNGMCVINKKNRTSCKACRLKKCIEVGMSKGGSRYGRRSNWFKIHCLLEQEQSGACMPPMVSIPSPPPPPRPNTWPMDFLGGPAFDQRMHFVTPQKSPREDMGFEEYKNASSPTISSPESHNSDSSVEIGERIKPQLNFYKPVVARDFQNPYIPFGALASLHNILHSPAFLPPLLPPNPNLLFSPGIVLPKPESLPTTPEAKRKRLHLDAILRSQRSPTTDDHYSNDEVDLPTVEDHSPMDLTVRPTSREDSCCSGDEEEEHITVDGDDPVEESQSSRLTTPLDLTTKVQ